MAAQPQPPYQQPVYTELNLAFDRLFVRMTGYVESRVEAVAAQLRVYNQESTQRDQDLVNLVLTLREESRKQIEALREESRQQIEALREETRQQIEALREETRQQIGAVLQLVRDNHAEAMEGINELRQAINDLRQKGSK